MKTSHSPPGRILSAFTILAVMLVVAGACFTGGDGEGVQQVVTPTVSIGNVVFNVEVAQTPDARAKGLSEHKSLEPLNGMLFVFETGRTTDFWMKGMRFPLDLVWISRECRVVDTIQNISPPASGQRDRDLPRYWSRWPAAFTLEINAGEAAEAGIKVGDIVTFSGYSGIPGNANVPVC